MVRSWYELSEYVQLRRVNGLSLSPDGTRLVAPVSDLAPDGRSFRNTLWEIDARPESEGGTAPRRLTRSTKGEAGAGFLPDGSLLFVSGRPDPEAESSDESGSALWLLPVDGGEARQIASTHGGVGAFTVARESGLVAFTGRVLPRSEDQEEDAEARKARKEAGVTAILHEALPVRSWDSDVGPDHPRLFVAEPPRDEDSRLGDPRDLTPDAGLSLLGASPALTPDIHNLITSWSVPAGGGSTRGEVVAIDTATGERRTIAGGPDEELEFGGPLVSPGLSPGVEPRARDRVLVDLVDPPRVQQRPVLLASSSCVGPGGRASRGRLRAGGLRAHSGDNRTGGRILPDRPPGPVPTPARTFPDRRQWRGSRTTVTKKSSIWRTTWMNRSKSTGLVT